VKHTEAGVKTQPHNEILTFKSSPGLSFVEHMTLYLFAILRSVITVLLFEPAGGRDGLPMGWSEVKAPFHPPLKVWIRGAQG
jgi:hypothetical protein